MTKTEKRQQRSSEVMRVIDIPAPIVTAYSVDTENLTVVATREHGEPLAVCEPCRDRGDLACLVAEMYVWGVYSKSVRDGLLWDLGLEVTPAGGYRE